VDILIGISGTVRHINTLSLEMWGRWETITAFDTRESRTGFFLSH
jgi:hypothetical protein